MSRELTKSQRKRIRELADIAYDRELAKELTLLEDAFARWRRGEISVHDLDHRIHEYHSGPHRELYVQYTSSHTDLIVAGAIVRGVIAESEAGLETVEVLRETIELIRTGQQNPHGDDAAVSEPE